MHQIPSVTYTGGIAISIIEDMLIGKLSDEEVAEAIISLRDKGESADDIYEYVEKINQHSVSIRTEGKLLDVCGTGGSGLSRFNVSTTCAFVLSALDVPIIKHGNRGSQRPNGSFDLLENLGIQIEQTPRQIEKTIELTNLGFVFAKHYHPSLSKVAKGRAIAGGRSIFNLAGPLSNPANIAYQVIGTADLTKAEILANACAKLGRTKAVVLYGEPGIDEASISGITHVYECSKGKVKYYTITPQELGIVPIEYSEIPGGDVDINTEIFQQLLLGEAHHAIVDMVSLNSGIGLYVVAAADSIKDGYEKSKGCILSGEMKKQFDEYLLAVKNTKNVTNK